jgi:hypothetical protein
MKNIKKNMTAEEVYERISIDGTKILDVEKLTQFLANMLAETAEEWEICGGDYYWYINEGGEVSKDIWAKVGIDYRRRDFLGVYPTKEAAEEARQEIKSKLGK